MKRLFCFILMTCVLMGIVLAGQKDFVLKRSRASHIAYLTPNISVRWWKVGQDTTTTAWLADTTDTIGYYDISDTIQSGQYYIYLDGVLVETLNHVRMRGDTLSFATMDPVFVLADKASGYDTINADANGNLKTALGDTASRVMWGIKADGSAAACSIDASGNLKTTAGSGGGGGPGRLYGTITGADSIPLRAVATDSSMRVMVNNSPAVTVSGSVTIDSTKTRLGMQITNSPTVLLDSLTQRLRHIVTRLDSIAGVKISGSRLWVAADSSGFSSEGRPGVQVDWAPGWYQSSDCSISANASIDTCAISGLPGNEFILWELQVNGTSATGTVGLAITKSATLLPDTSNMIWIATSGTGASFGSGVTVYPFGLSHNLAIPIATSGNTLNFCIKGGATTAGHGRVRALMTRADIP